MKIFRSLLVLLLVLSALTLLLGCTPNDDSSGKATTEATHVNGTAEADRTAETATAAVSGMETVSNTETTTEEIESDTDSTYTFVIEEGYGVGGN